MAATAANIATPSAPAPAAAAAAGARATEQTAAEIDHRRAHQLLDRALMLSERGDVQGAILACRQAVSLAPASAQGYSMWGLLLERSGETGKAIAAYEKVLELAPDSMLERESLQRLRATAARNSLTGTFHFDDRELFDDALGAATPTAAAATPAVGAAVPAATTVGAGAATANAATVPVAPVTPPPSVPTPTPLRFDDPTDTATGGPLWLQALLRQPSYYFRGAPLMATTIIGLLFLLWARDWAAVRYQPAPAPAPAGTVTEVVPSDQNAPADQVNTNATPAVRTSPDGGQIVTNNPNAVATPGAATTTTNTTTTAGGGTTRTTTHTATSGGGGGGGSTTPRIPNPIPPANPRTTGSRPGTGSRPASGIPDIPAPRIDNSRTPAEAPITITPGTSDGGGSAPAGGGTSAGGGPLNPSANTGRGYIRITPEAPERVVPRSVSPASAPARPDNVADNNERLASADARSGRTGRATERLASAASSGGSTGYRYQQRATLFLERGDYARAADEYQTAISAYQDQINRGESVAQARAGMRSARSGLRVALAGLNR
jgi:tetratricopeptide (TPR) repeat protein